MLKLKTRKCNKTNSKDVGDVPWTTSSSKTYSNPNSKIQTLTSDLKGITLIALIITIIVMLILVGVTVNVALNGGLFSTAEEATFKTRKEVDREQLLAEIVNAMDDNGQIDFTQLENNLKQLGWKVTVSGNKATCTSPNNNSFEVEKNGNITDISGGEEPPETEEIGILKDYLFGKADENGQRKGKDLSKIITIEGSGTTILFSDDTETNEEKFSDKLQGLDIVDLGYRKSEDELIYDFDVYFRYDDDNDDNDMNNPVYKVRISGVGEYSADNLTGTTRPDEEIKVYDPDDKSQNRGLVGKEVTYDGKKWIVLYDDEINGVQMISKDILGEIDIGLNDSSIQWDNSAVKNETDIDKNNELSDKEKAIYSYNHAIGTLNDKCKELVGKDNSNEVIESIRCVGSNPTSPYSENKELYSSSKLREWLEGVYDKKSYSTDQNYEDDYGRLLALGITKVSDDYIWASRIVMWYPPWTIQFSFRIVYSELGFGITHFNYLTAGGGLYGAYSFQYGVRAVVSLNDEIRNRLVEQGIEDVPFNLDEIN